MHACTHTRMHACMHTDTHTTILHPSWIMSGATWVSWHQKGETNQDLLEHRIVSGSGISWAICKSAHWPRHITMPASHHSSFSQAECPNCRPTNSIKVLKAKTVNKKTQILQTVNIYLQDYDHISKDLWDKMLLSWKVNQAKIMHTKPSQGNAQ